MKQRAYVAYIRVSTKGQEKSGLGLEAQREIIRHYAHIDQMEVVCEFVETESGKEIDNRPQLQKAVAFCLRENYVLVVAKLDRLSRDVEHIFKLMRVLGGRFKSFDLPSTDSFTLSIFAGLAQREREIIGIRTKQALKAKKAQGVKLGKPENFSDEGRRNGAGVMKEKARSNEGNIRATKLIEHCREKNMTFEEIAEQLNSNGFQTVRGKRFQKMTVKLLWDRSKIAR